MFDVSLGYKTGRNMIQNLSNLEFMYLQELGTVEHTIGSFKGTRLIHWPSGSVKLNISNDNWL